MKKVFTAYLESPLGIVEIKATAQFITAINFVLDEGADSENLPPIIAECKKQLEEYFAGTRKEFSLKVKPEGSTFQKAVWKELEKIPYGETKSYGAIARQLNDTKVTRAVGHANGKNPVAVIIPCHRVIGQNGQLTGYAGGMWRKRWLLDLEGNVSGKNLTLF